MKACPFCAEQIQEEAIKCRFCGSMLDAGAATQAPDDEAAFKYLDHASEYTHKANEHLKRGKLSAFSLANREASVAVSMLGACLDVSRGSERMSSKLKGRYDEICKEVFSAQYIAAAVLLGVALDKLANRDVFSLLFGDSKQELMEHVESSLNTFLQLYKGEALSVAPSKIKKDLVEWLLSKRGDIEKGIDQIAANGSATQANVYRELLLL